MSKVLIIGSRARYEKFYPATEFADSLEKVYVDLGTPVEDILEKAKDAWFIAADAIAEVPAELIEQMPDLRLIQSEGVAFNRIDCKAAAKRGIPVCNNKGINAAAVAEQAVFLMLGLLRTGLEGDRAVREGRQIQMKERRMLEGITELGDCQVGLIGFGDIGKATARLLSAFGCRISYYASCRKTPELEKEYGVEWMTPEDMAGQCDIISLHMPVTDQTAGMIDEEFLKKMKQTAFLINTARGELIDNMALVKALEEGWIAGAGLDTVSPEPVPADHPLLHMSPEAEKKVLFSPHLGGITTSTFKRAHRNIWKAFEDAACGRKPANIVNGI